MTHRTSFGPFLRLCVAALALQACGGTEVDRASTPAAPTASAPIAAKAPSSPCRAETACQRALESNEASIRAQTKRLETVAADWRHHQQLAALHVRNARLTGRYEPYARAEAALGRAFELAPEGAGPFLDRAQLNFTLHRFAEVEADLARAEASPLGGSGSVIAGMRADLALYRGDELAAARGFAALESMPETMDSLVRLANYAKYRGRFDEADALLARAATHVSPRFAHTHAWLLLQRGLVDLDRGALADARAHYDAASERYDGWYLIDEHIAELDALQGRTAVAIAAYEDLVSRTENPEFMAALAESLRDAGREEDAANWVGRAQQSFDGLVEAFPAAAGGHALDFYLEHGKPDRALELARSNLLARPYAPARLKLASAVLKSGDAQRAAELLTDVEQTAFRSADVAELRAQLAESHDSGASISE